MLKKPVGWGKGITAVNATVLQHILPCCQPSCAGRKQHEDVQKKTLAVRHLILSQVWSGFLWEVVICCHVVSGGETFMSASFLLLFFKSGEVMELLPNLTLNIGMFCLSWTLQLLCKVQLHELLETHIPLETQCLNSYLTLTYRSSWCFPAFSQQASKFSLKNIKKLPCTATGTFLTFCAFKWKKLEAFSKGLSQWV